MFSAYFSLPSFQTVVRFYNFLIDFYRTHRDWMAKVIGSTFPLLNGNFVCPTTHIRREREMAFEERREGERGSLRLGLTLDKNKKLRVLVRSET